MHSSPDDKLEYSDLAGAFCIWMGASAERLITNNKTKASAYKAGLS
jgi:hypothetical protein